MNRKVKINNVVKVTVRGRGPQGIQGVPGVQGIQGIQGLQGETGGLNEEQIAKLDLINTVDSFGDALIFG